MIIRIHHNVETDSQGRYLGAFGYEYGHRLIEVFTYRENDPISSDLYLCRVAFFLFNVGDNAEFGEPHPFAIAYRLAGHRSLSVGDVVQVGNCFYACAPDGWKVLQADEVLQSDEMQERVK